MRDAGDNGRGGGRRVHAPGALRPFGAATTLVQLATGGGTLPVRTLAAGILLTVGLPALTLVVYLWDYPSALVRWPLVALVDALQLLIVAYAVVIGAQVLAYARTAATRARRGVPAMTVCGALPRGDRASPTALVPSAATLPRAGLVVLREWSVQLANQIWTREQHAGAELHRAVLACIRDGVTLELEHRRRSAALERRAAELEAWIPQDSVVASERM